jgi:Fe-S oxidoreductase
MDDARLFRYAPGYRALALDTALDWSAWDVHADPVADTVTAPGTGGDPARGFGKAIDMCNNNGHCRKFDAGTMCPSFRATRDEEHVTRGRANTLRLAVSGQLGPDFANEAVRHALDLCVSCKGCRRECPTGVDMAKMKIEFNHHWAKKHGVSIKDKLVAYLPRYAHWGARLPWLFNLRDQLPGAAALSEKWLGLARQRSLPKWRSDTFLGGLMFPLADDGSIEPQSRGPAGEVVLFADTFANAFEPEIAHDALAVLEAAGYTVHIALPADRDRRPLCCGRTFLAAGLVDEAKREARRTLDALAPYVARGAAIVGLEPSCLLGMRDEFLVMGLGADAQRVAERAFLFEEFIAAEARAGRLAVDFAPLAGKRVLLHGHCHQKAFDAMGATVAALRLIPELDVQVVESSCCGMAGSFGYEAAHYDVSMKMAEFSLLPAVRQAGDDTLIVADGTSCRHQIADGTGGTRRPLHAARVLARALRMVA